MRTISPDTFAGGGEYSIIDAVNDEDERNALLEFGQEFVTTTSEFKVDDYVFKLTRHEPNKKRTYQDANENYVHYPEMLMVHGFVSDESYFGGAKDGMLTEQMCRLGLTVNTLTLPDGMGHLSAEEILEIQARGVQAAYNSLSTGKAKGSEVILTAHSRGAIVATHAAELLSKEHANYDKLTPEEQAQSAKPLRGLVLLAPAGLHPIGPQKARNGLNIFGKSTSILGSAALAIPGLVFSSRGDIINHPRPTIKYLGMAAKKLVIDPQMRLKEAEIAASADIRSIIQELSREMSILIIGAKNDAFVNHIELSEFVKGISEIQELKFGDLGFEEISYNMPTKDYITADEENIDEVDLNNGANLFTIDGLSHMLLGKKFKSYADPRGLPGIMLQFFQSRMPGPKDGKENGHSPISYKKGKKKKIDKDGNIADENAEGELGIPKPYRL